jgi:large subunit ribosomal protein L3
METIEIKGKKLNMSQVFKEDGTVVPVTLVKVDSEDPAVDESSLKDKSVSVVGTSKGKGFTGVIKRWGFHKQPMTRGASDKVRTGGAIGSQTPGRVWKGKKMAGRKGGSRVTVKGLQVMDFDQKEGIIKVSGSIPGARNSGVTLKVLE